MEKILITPRTLTSNPLPQLDRLRVISRNGIGGDSLPMAFLTSRGMDVKRAEGSSATGVLGARNATA